MEFPAWEREKWQDRPENPLIAPLEQVIGDPQIILPGEFDDLWHLFCIGRGHFDRFDSPDGIAWTLAHDHFWNSGPACVTCDGRQWIVLYSRHGWPESADSVICGRTSADLAHWSEPVELIAPELGWEREGRVSQVRNPNLVRLPVGRFRLYYCGGTVWMDDMNFEEPKYIDFAEATGPLGPFEKRAEPILGPDPGISWRACSAGAMKVFRYGGSFLGLANGLYHDGEGHSRSAVEVLMSDDGVAWRDAPYGPIIEPSGDGWKKALVYQLDLRWFEGKLRLYYNARDGWRGAREWIGCSTLDWQGPSVEKLWRLPL